MATEIIVPAFGESVVEATVGNWLKKEGDSVAAGEPVVELETEKVNTQVSAEDSGVLSRIMRREGETVHPGDVLAEVETGAQVERPAAAPAAEAAVPTAEAQPPPQPYGQPATVAAPISEQERRRVSPAAQRLAEELQIDLGQVRGTGPGGRVMREDVEGIARGRAAPAGVTRPSRPEAAPAPPAAPEAAPPAPVSPVPPRPAAPAQPPQPAAAAPPVVETGRREVRQRMSRRRLTIARRLVEVQQTAAMLTTFNEIDMSAVVDLRRRRRESFRQSTGSDLGFMPFFVKAVVGALKAFPQVNAEIQGEELLLKYYYDIGIAIGDEEGLVVPVVRDADRLSFAQIEQTIQGYVQKAQNRALSLDDLRGGTFTITNGGIYGSLMSTPMLNPPQVGILGMHKISERPVAVNGEMVIRPMMYVALTYDHRVIDGRDSVRFLVKVKELVEDPERLLLEG